MRTKQPNLPGTLLVIALVALVATFALRVIAGNRYSTSITVISTPTNGMTLTVNGDTRTWSTNANLLFSEIRLTNSALNSVHATNLFRNIAATPFGAVIVSQPQTNVVKLVGQVDQTLTVTELGGWATFSTITNSTATGTEVVVPFSSEPSANVRTNVASLLVRDISAFASNRFGANVLPSGTPTNIQSQVPWLQFSGITAYILGTNATLIPGLHVSDVLLLDGTRPMAGPLNMGGFSITNLLAGVAALDAVNMAQLAGATNGLGSSGGDVFTTSNNTFSAGTTNTFDFVAANEFRQYGSAPTNSFGGNMIVSNLFAVGGNFLSDFRMSVKPNRNSGDGILVANENTGGSACSHVVIGDNSTYGLSIGALPSTFSALPQYVHTFTIASPWRFSTDASGSYDFEYRVNGIERMRISATDVFVTNANLTVVNSFNQIPLSFSMPMSFIGSGSNWVTFAHGVVPTGKTVTINHAQSLAEDGTDPSTNQVLRVYDVSNAMTLLATNGNWIGTLTITNGLRWYARFENNSTNDFTGNASVHGNIK